MAVIRFSVADWLDVRIFCLDSSSTAWSCTSLSLLCLYSRLSLALACLSARSWLDLVLVEGATTTLCGWRNLAMARAAVRQVTVRMVVTPNKVERRGWWYMRYLIPERSHGQILRRELLICNLEVCSSNSILEVGDKVVSDSVWLSSKGMGRMLVELVKRAMCNGRRRTDSKEVTINDLYGTSAEVQVVVLVGKRVEQAKNIPTSLLAGESGTSSNSSTLYLLPLTICFLNSFTSLLMKLQG